MATKFQIKRTSVSGRTPNTADPANTSYIAGGELALNLTDKKLFSSDGTNYFEIGSNVSSLSAQTIVIGNSTVNTAINSTSIAVTEIIANGTNGSSGDVLFSDGANAYWAPSGALSTNVNAAFAWTNAHTFSNTVTFNSVVQANGAPGTNGQVLTSNGTGGVYWANSTGGGAVVLSTYVYTVASNTTVFEGIDDNSKVLEYTINKESVYLNGVRLIKGSDYTQSNTTAITLTANAISGDTVEIVTLAGADSSQTFKFSIASNTTAVTGNDDGGTPLSYIAGYELIYLNGIKLVFGSDYTTPNTTHIVLSANAISGDIVEVITFPADSTSIDLANPTAYGSASTGTLTIDTYNATSYRTAKYLVQANTVDSFHSSEAVVIHDGTTAFISEYGMVYSNGSLFSLSADISTGVVRLRATPTRSGTTFKSKRIILEV